MTQDSKRPSIIWFRQDLRIEDQPALRAAAEKGGAVIPVFIQSFKEDEWSPGAASRWWLHGALKRLKAALEEMGLPLILKKGPPLGVLIDLCKETGADTVFCNRLYEPFSVHQDERIRSSLGDFGVKMKVFNGSVLFELEAILNKQNRPYQVFTHFWNFCSHFLEPRTLCQKPHSVQPYQGTLSSIGLEELHLLPEFSWDAKFYAFWDVEPGAAARALERALDEVVNFYPEKRDFLSLKGTSFLSPYLHFGELSPSQIWYAVKGRLDEKAAEAGSSFLRQIGWREFAHYLLHHFPHMPKIALDRNYPDHIWQRDEKGLNAWKKGLVGYPIVDAAMRQLWHTGWMHNRARMIAGSFLVKDLLIDWREGQRWFWETLVDADLANNAQGWQWIAGCGVDAAPYFRVFNPVSQGEKFDPEGEYIRKWVPELSRMPNRWIHSPWEAPPIVLKAAGVELGASYPMPIVDHAAARNDYLHKMNEFRNGNATSIS